MERIERDAFLAHATLPTFKRKVEKAKEIIREALAIAPSYVAVSWGKDSVVMLHLVQSICPDILAVFLGHSEQDLITNFSGVQNSYLTKFASNYKAIFLDRNQELEYSPTKIKDALDRLQIPLAFVGVRSEESKVRRFSVKKYGYIYQYKAGNFRCYPIANFSWIDIWAYTCLNELPYLEAYDKIDFSSPESRTSLHFGRSKKSALGVQRFERFKRICPQFFEYVKENYEGF
jgi:3'-phosphoadenosine 5'-phosphosulfate sulfotransferase (PAPS reductase)/FAD synthetase